MADDDLTSNPQYGDQQFDLDAGIVCLDFANTLSARTGEHLQTYSDLLAFALQSHLITQPDADRLQALARRQPKASADVLNRARRLRSALREVFSSVANAAIPSPREMGVLNRDLSIGMRFAQLALAAATSSDDGGSPSGGGSGYVWTWKNDPARLDAPLWAISRSAAELLTSDALRPLVRECGADDCKWLFLDTSKNRSRQWCSMSSCGNREKARRHYERVRSRRPAGNTMLNRAD